MGKHLWHEVLGRQDNDILAALANPAKLRDLKPIISKQELLSLCLHGGYPEPVLKRADKKFFRL